MVTDRPQFRSSFAVQDQYVTSREADAVRRAELHLLDSRLCNIRAVFAIATFVILVTFIFGALRGQLMLAAVGAAGVVVLGWCLASQYRLMRKRDELARSLSWIGLDNLTTVPRFDAEARNEVSAQVMIKEAA
jgi:hypothetical protein